MDDDKDFNLQVMEWLCGAAFYIGYSFSHLGLDKNTRVNYIKEYSRRLRIRFNYESPKYTEFADKYTGNWLSVRIYREQKQEDISNNLVWCPGWDHSYDPYRFSFQVRELSKIDDMVHDVESLVKAIFPHADVDECYVCGIPFDLREVSRGKEPIFVCGDDSIAVGTEKDSHGYVYLMGNEEAGYFKIGRSKDTRKRLNQVKTPLPFDIHIIHTIPCDDYVLAESMLHSEFFERASKGEWFKLLKQDVDRIKGIASFENDEFKRK